MDSPKIKVAVIDDSALSRKKLANLIEKDTDLHVVTEAETGPAEINAVERQRPDVIIMGINEEFSRALENQHDHR